MPAPYRNLAPAPATQRDGAPRQTPLSEELATSRRRPPISAACRPCQRRKTKCDGRRPTCTSCSATQFQCEWDTEPGLTRRASLKARNGKLEGALATLLEAFWYLQTQPYDKAKQVLDQIRDSTDVSAVLEYLNAQQSVTQDPSHGKMAWQALGQTQQEAMTMAPQSKQRRSSMVVSDGTLPAAESTSITHEKHPALDHPLQYGGDKYLQILERKDVIVGLRSGIKAFGLYTAVMFHVFEPDELEDLTQGPLEGIASSGQAWILRAPPDEACRRRSLLSQLCAVAALGLQYNDDPDVEVLPRSSPDSADPTTRVDDLSKTFYQVSKAFLDEAIECSPFHAIKLCALFGIFTVIEHPSVALAYTHFGLTFAMDCGLFSPAAPPFMSKADFVSYRKLLRTLITLRCWLTSTLAFVPGTGFDSRMASIDVPRSDQESTPEALIQQKVMEATVVASNLVRTASSFANLSSPILRTIDDDILRWDVGLAEELQLEHMMQRTSPIPPWCLVGLHMHLLHLSIYILKARTVHAMRQGSSVDYTQEEMRTAVVGGIQAARSCSQILERLLNEDMVFRKASICINSAFCSASTLLWCSSQAMLSSRLPQAWQSDVRAASTCYQLLEYCAPRHSIAQMFVQTLNPIMAIVRAAATDISDNSMMTDQPPTPTEPSTESDYIFAIPKGSGSLYKANTEIYNILGRPFAGTAEDPSPQAMRASDGGRKAVSIDGTKYVTSAFNGQTDNPSLGGTQDNRELRESLEILGATHFAGSTAPHV